METSPSVTGTVPQIMEKLEVLESLVADDFQGVASLLAYFTDREVWLEEQLCRS